MVLASSAASPIIRSSTSIRPHTVNKYSNGIDAYILILLDERIAGLGGELRNDGYTGVANLHMIFHRRTGCLGTEKAMQALLLVADDGNRILYSEQLGRESARLDRVFLYEDKSKPTFIVVTIPSAWDLTTARSPIFLEVSATGIHDIFPR